MVNQRKNVEKERKNKKPNCPECGSKDLVIAGKCATCMNCGWSLCSL